MGFDIESTATDDVTLVEIGCVVGKIDDTASQLRVNTQESTLTIEETGTLFKSDKEYKLKTKPIYDEAYYRKLFNEITVEVKRRQADKLRFINICLISANATNVDIVTS